MTRAGNNVIAAAVVAGIGLLGAGSAQAGLINPTSTVTPTFFWDQGTGQQSYTSSNGSTAAPPPFSLAAPYTAADVPNVPYIVNAQVYMLFTDSTITIVNAAADAMHNAPFCFSSMNSGAACADLYDRFDFAFTNENIATATINTTASAAWEHWSAVEPNVTGPNHFSIDVTGDFPALGASLVIDLTFGGTVVTPAPEPASFAVLATAGAGLISIRRRKLRT